MLEKSTIEKLVKDCESRFEQIKTQLNEKTKEVTLLEDELKRMQGEYRAFKKIDEVIKNNEKNINNNEE